MNKILKSADQINNIVEVQFDPYELNKVVEELIYDNLDIEVSVLHDYDEVERYNNYYLIVDTLLLEEEEISKIEKFLSISIDDIYGTTLSILDELFKSYATTSYVKLIDSMVTDSSPIVVEFTPENYKLFTVGE